MAVVSPADGDFVARKERACRTILSWQDLLNCVAKSQTVKVMDYLQRLLMVLLIC